MSASCAADGVAYGSVNEQGSASAEMLKASSDGTHLKEIIYSEDHRDICSFLFAVQGHFGNDGNGAGAAYALTRALLFTRLLCGQMTLDPARVSLPADVTVRPGTSVTPAAVFTGYATPQQPALKLPDATEATRIGRSPLE
jgi:hypothetical protein